MPGTEISSERRIEFRAFQARIFWPARLHRILRSRYRLYSVLETHDFQNFAGELIPGAITGIHQMKKSQSPFPKESFQGLRRVSGVSGRHPYIVDQSQ